MPVYHLTEHNIFPAVNKADSDGLLAIGGDLNVERLLLAYKSGIFPWYSDGMPILWWSPEPRMVLFPTKFKVSKSLSRVIKSKKFHISFDTQFENVIEYCSSVRRKGQNGTWLTDEMKIAYCNLHKEGYAHSVETFYNGRLVGGLYGVSIGKAFFGESMFYLMSDASKVALYYLIEKLKQWNFYFIDAQIKTEHLVRLGAVEISRKDYIKLLKKALKYDFIKGRWTVSM